MTLYMWRVGSKVPINVYEGDRPVCQCHNEQDAARIVAGMNRTPEAIAVILESMKECSVAEPESGDTYVYRPLTETEKDLLQSIARRVRAL